MKFIDLFSGIGGFRSGLEKNGHKAIAYSEVDKYAKQSYTSIYETSEELDLGDITKVSNEQWQDLKGKANIIVGGSPCQSFSLAGKRRGFEDTRGTLFFHYVNAIKEVQPEFFIFENVKGMMSHDKGETIKTVLSSFNEIGYDIDFDVFNSKYYGVPQNRERIYIVGKRKDLGINESRESVKSKKKLDQLKNWAIENINYVKLLPENNNENVEKRLVDVLEDKVDEKYYLSEEKTKKLTLNLDLTESKKSGIAIKQVGNIVDNKETFGGNPQRGRVYNSEGLSPALNCMRGGGLEPKIAVREATKQGYAIAEQGDSVNVSYPTSKTRRGRVGKQVAQTLQAGEVNQGVIINPLKDKTYKSWRYEQNVFDSNGITRSLKASLGGTPEIINKKYNQLRIRKLTPLECWRLQGFKDEQFYKAKDNGVSNSQLYKQAGNAVTVNVVDAITKELIKHGLQ